MKRLTKKKIAKAIDAMKRFDSLLIYGRYSIFAVQPEQTRELRYLIAYKGERCRMLERKDVLRIIETLEATAKNHKWKF